MDPYKIGFFFWPESVKNTPKNGLWTLLGLITSGCYTLGFLEATFVKARADSILQKSPHFLPLTLDKICKNDVGFTGLGWAENVWF
jgi:hypothetical protein